MIMGSVNEDQVQYWWDSLDESDRDMLLDAAEFDGHERSPSGAHDFMARIPGPGLILYVYPGEDGEFHGWVVNGGERVCDFHASTAADVCKLAASKGFGDIPRIRVASLSKVRGFEREPQHQLPPIEWLRYRTGRH